MPIIIRTARTIAKSLAFMNGGTEWEYTFFAIARGRVQRLSSQGLGGSRGPCAAPPAAIAQPVESISYAVKIGIDTRAFHRTSTTAGVSPDGRTKTRRRTSR